MVAVAWVLTALFFVLVYRDAMQLAGQNDPGRRRQAVRVLFWMLVFWPVGLYLLSRLRKEAERQAQSRPGR